MVIMLAKETPSWHFDGPGERKSTLETRSRCKELLTALRGKGRRVSTGISGRLLENTDRTRLRSPNHIARVGA